MPVNKLTKKQKGFADDYMTLGNGTRAALKNYETIDNSTAGAIASENLRKPNIVQYIEDNAKDAMSRIVELSMTAKNEGTKYIANKDIVDRAGYTVPQQSPFVQQSILVIMPTEIIKRNALHTDESTISDSKRPS